MTILQAQGVVKRYPGKRALDGLELTLGAGRIAGLFGPNGSGKTTFLKIITGLAHPTRGRVEICGEPLDWRTRALVAYLPDSDFLYDWMRIREAGDVYARFYADFDRERYGKLLKFMRLEPDAAFKSLSRGMREKLGLALTLSRRARLTVLDEPLGGVDPIAREQILGAIIREFRIDSSMLITSHLIHEFETVVDEAFYIKDGKIVLSGDTEALREQRGKTLDELYREVFAQ